MNDKPKPPPAETHATCKACGTRFEKYWDFASFDQYPDGLRVHFWCPACDGHKGHK